MATVAWVVFVGSLFVGILYVKKYVNSRQKTLRSDERKLQVASLPSQHIRPLTAALCLVVPASVIVDLRNKYPDGLIDNYLNISDVKTLIDNASYFLCTTIKEAKLKEQLLKWTQEEIPINSNREVYIKVDIDNGQYMIDKQSLYILKRNLPLNGKCIVKRYDCLKNLSGLKNFNHI